MEEDARLLIGGCAAGWLITDSEGKRVGPGYESDDSAWSEEVSEELLLKGALSVSEGVAEALKIGDEFLFSERWVYRNWKRERELAFQFLEKSFPAGQNSA